MARGDGVGAARVPAIPLCLSVGVTGHRDLGDADGAIAARLGDILHRLHAAASALAGSACFAPAPLVARLVCPLAAGADQIAAAAALAQGYALHAFLPFGRDDYRADFAP